MRSLTTCTLPKYILNYQVEMDGAWLGVQHAWGEDDCIYDYGWKARRKEITRKTMTYVEG
jgi:hypothetical protein